MMKNTMKLFALVAFVFAAFTASAQSSKPVKLGHFEMNAIVALMPETKAAEDAVEQKRQEAVKLMQEMTTNLQNLFQEYQKNLATYSDMSRAAKEEEIENLRQRIEDFQQRAEVDLQNTWREKMEPVFEKVRKAVKEVGDQNGFTYIFEASTLNYISPTSEDVTPMIKKKLNLL